MQTKNTMPSKEVSIHKKGSSVIIEPNNLAALLDSWAPPKDEFPEIKDLPPEDATDF